MMIKTTMRGSKLVSGYLFASSSLKDWEYIMNIEKSLKKNNVNEALNYLIDSNLNQKVLDIHTFHNFYKRIHEQQYSLSYYQLSYKLFREHFNPQPLFLDWMKELSGSMNPTVTKMIEQDYKYLKKTMPVVQKRSQQQQDAKMMTKNKKEKQKQEHQKRERQNKEQQKKSFAQGNNKASTSSTSQVSTLPSSSHQKSYKLQPQTKKISLFVSDLSKKKQQESTLIQNEAHQFLQLNLKLIKELISSLSNLNVKLVLHNTQFVFENDEDDESYDEEEDENVQRVQEFQKQQLDLSEDAKQLSFFELVKKIKIQKIEIVLNDDNSKHGQNTNFQPKK